MELTSYLDDPDHDWSLDTEAKRQSLGVLLADLAEADELAQRIILAGFLGLKERHPEASYEDCLLTSLIWYFG